MAERHRSTLKQKNRPFKPKGRTRPKSKGKNKVGSLPYTPIDWESLNKSDRTNHNIQKRKIQREELTRKRRGLPKAARDEMQLDSSYSAPKNIAILSMNSEGDAVGLSQSIQSLCQVDESGITTHPKFKHCPMQICVVAREITHVLDVLKCADVLVVVFQCGTADFSNIKRDPFSVQCIDNAGYEFLSAIKTQGMPRVVGVLQGLINQNPTKHTEIKKLYNRFFDSEFPNNGKLCLDTNPEMLMMQLCNAAQSTSPMAWRDYRAYIMTQNVQIQDNSIALKGYLQGSGHLSADSLVHITGYGDFAIDHIETPDGNVFYPQNPPSLNPENDPGIFNAEQTWPTEDELAEAMANLEIVPTDHEPYVLPDDDEDEADSSFMVEESVRTIEIEPRSREEMSFPDEVDTPQDMLARERFVKFKGLKSFKTSFWDPYENLPTEYGKLYEFQTSNNKVFKAALKEDTEKSMFFPGQYIAIYLKDFPVQNLQQHPNSLPLILSTLLPYERKLSILHFRIERQGDLTTKINSKQPLTFCCGFRRFVCRPIYSEESTSDKFKYLRDLTTSGVASIYAPIMFPPANLLVYNTTSISHTLVATGNLLGFDPKRIIVKRILLTGYPFKIHKRKAVIRYMFFDPRDIRYFKPIEMFTKNGLRGHIRDSIGTHGHMKCVFNDFVKHGDIVCMPLYRRVFPVWDSSVWSQDVQLNNLV